MIINITIIVSDEQVGLRNTLFAGLIVEETGSEFVSMKLNVCT